MAISLYDLTVLGFLQTASAVAGFLDRGAAHCVDNDIDPNELFETRLFPDMQPLRYQVLSVYNHSVGAIEGCQAGQFNPMGKVDATDYAGLQKVAADTRAALQALRPEAVNALQGKDVFFSVGEYKLEFTAENFLMSFSIPNFHFHATTAYDILRNKGVPLGKRDYLGALRTKG
jgi:hypothetical protein